MTASGGIATFGDLTLSTVGTYTLTVSSQGLSSANFTISVATTGLVVTQTPPAEVNTGGGFQIGVTAEDLSGNVDNSFSGQVTVSIRSGPAGAVLGGPTTATAVNGVASFYGLTLDTPGAYTLDIASNGLADVDVSLVAAGTHVPVPKPAPVVTTTFNSSGTLVSVTFASSKGTVTTVIQPYGAFTGAITTASGDLLAMALKKLSPDPRGDLAVVRTSRSTPRAVSFFTKSRLLIQISPAAFRLPSARFCPMAAWP